VPGIAALRDVVRHVGNTDSRYSAHRLNLTAGADAVKN
jgi:hypothetical protein